jgi:hypothetical protein
MDVDTPARVRNSGGVFAWWWRVVRFAVLGQAPKAPEDVVAWALCVPHRIWRIPKRPGGSSFADSYTRGWPAFVRWIVPFRFLYLLFLLAWPLVALGRSVGRPGRFRRAMTRADLAMTFPPGAPGEREAAWIRPDYVVGMYYAWEYTRIRPKYHALDDKRRFVSACLEAGLPVPPTLTAAEAVARGGSWIVKEPLSDRGVGVFWMDAAELVRQDDAAELLVQERLSNHPALLEVLPRDAPLSTLRVITTLESPHGRPVVTRLALRAGRAGRLTDNAAGGGLWAPVDLVTGAVGPALRRATFLKREHGLPVRDLLHPDSGRPFSRLRVPFLAEARAFAVRAHEMLAPGAVSLGWDVGLSASGPVLLEVNFWAASYDDPPPDDAFGPLGAILVARVRELST